MEKRRDACAFRHRRGSIDNFYQTDVVSRASRVMARCVVAKREMRYEPGHHAPQRAAAHA